MGGRVKRSTGRGIVTGGVVAKGVKEATEAPLVGEGTLRTDSEETDELPPQNEEFLLESGW
jgi:hypothetical protein